MLRDSAAGRMTPRQRGGTMGAARSGFFGCFGAAAGGLVLLFALMVAAQLAGDRVGGRVAKGHAEPRELVTYCALAVLEAQGRSPRLAGAQASSDDPQILAAGPPT